MKTILTLSLFCFSIHSLLGQTVIDTSEVSGIWTIANSPYIITRGVNVSNSKRLIIEAGVEIRFRSGGLFVGAGSTIIAEGTPEKMIKFTSDKSGAKPGDWTGLELYGTGKTSSIRHCVIEYATIGLKLQAKAYGCDVYPNFTPVENCIIRYNRNDGVNIMASGDKNRGCLSVRTGVCSPELRYNKIYGNGYVGIRLDASYGYESRGYVGAVIERNLIYENGTNGIACSGSYDCEPKIRNNTIVQNAEAGISYLDNFDPKDFIISNNILVKNGVGILAERDSVASGGYNDVWNNQINYLGNDPKRGDISLDPQFENGNARDFRLKCTSPCLDAGDPLSPVDQDGSIADLGALPSNRSFLSNFSNDRSEGYPPFSVTFQALPKLGEIQIEKYLWDFGDGATSTQRNPVHVYKKPGVYDVSLRITNQNCGLSDEKKVVGQIRAINHAPVVANPVGVISMKEDIPNQDLNLISLFEDENKNTLQYQLIASPHLNLSRLNQALLISPFPENWFGEEEIAVSATDEWGETTTHKIRVKVLPVNDPPELISFFPGDPILSVTGSAPVQFSVEAKDVDSQLRYVWKINGVVQAGNRNSLAHVFDRTGAFSVEVELSDEEFTRKVSWTVNVQLSTSAISPPSWLQGIRIYPNPFSDYLSIELELSRPIVLEIMLVDALGRAVSTWDRRPYPSGVTHLNWQKGKGLNLSAGVYYLCLMEGGQRWVVPAVLGE